MFVVDGVPFSSDTNSQGNYLNGNVGSSRFLDIDPIIDANCISCHANGESASFLPLTSYAQVKTSAESGLLISRMNNAASPTPKHCSWMNQIENWFGLLQR